MTRKIFQVGFGVLLRVTFDIVAQFQVDSIKFDLYFSTISDPRSFFSPPIPNVRRNKKKTDRAQNVTQMKLFFSLFTWHLVFVKSTIV